MHQFPLLTAIAQGARFLLGQRMVQLGLWTIAELLPSILVPPLAYLLWVHSPAEAATLVAWLRPWLYSQAAIVGMLCVALPGRWHWRVGLAVLAVMWIWGAAVVGMQSTGWSPPWTAATAKSLAGEIFWVFTSSAFIASLLVSVAGLELRTTPSRSAARPPRARQFSLGALMAWAFVCALTLAAGRAAIGLSVSSHEFRQIMGIDPALLPQLAIWSAGASISMIAAVATRRPLLCLAIVLALTIAADYALYSLQPSVWQGPSWVIAMATAGWDSRVWWPALIIVGHSFAMARLLPHWGFETHSPAARAFVQRVVAAAR